MNKILVVEDEPLIREAVCQLLQRNNYIVESVESVEQAGQLGNLKDFDLALSDLRLPGESGIAMIELIKPVPVIIMTSYAEVETAVQAMKLGAVDYVSKPFNHQEMLMVIEKALHNNQEHRVNETLKAEVNRIYPVEAFIGSCPQMQTVFRQIEKVAQSDVTVIISGESGTGKELIARSIHQKSRRADAPFIAFNCASISDAVLDEQLFGNEHKTGLLNQAKDGSLFLDEIGELPLSVQARLLSVLQQDNARDANIRFIAATHHDLANDVQSGKFRSDLYFRLRVVEIHAPPLRDRGNDIDELAAYLVERSCKQLGRPALTLSRGAQKAIKKYRWPGNIRELSNSLERAVLMCDGEEITPDLLAIDYQIEQNYVDQNQNSEMSLEEYFRSFVLQHQNSMTETEIAKRLGISRKALWERRQKFGIPRK